VLPAGSLTATAPRKSRGSARFKDGSLARALDQPVAKLYGPVVKLDGGFVKLDGPVVKLHGSVVKPYRSLVKSEPL
jgi:hypothetical protein